MFHHLFAIDFRTDDVLENVPLKQEIQSEEAPPSDERTYSTSETGICPKKL